MRSLALDIGEVRVGIAVSDKDGVVASPLCVLSAQEVFQQAPAFKRVLEDWEPEQLVVGFPRTLSGETGPQARRIKQEAEVLAQNLHLPVVFVDERLSSKEAKQHMAAAGMTQKKMRGNVDKIAAALFLQSYLDQTKAPAQTRTQQDRGTQQPRTSQQHRASQQPRGSQQNRDSQQPRASQRHRASHFSDPSAARTEKSSKQKASNKRVKRPVFLGVAIALGALLLALILALSLCHHKTHKDGDMVTVQIAQGATGDAIAKELVEADLIDTPQSYYDAARSMDAAKSIQSGTYEFRVGTSIEDIVRQLVKGPNTSQNRLTVPEGSTLKQTAQAAEAALGIPADDFIAQAKASNYVGTYAFLDEAAKTKQNTLEGYLWPSTYDFTGQEVSAKNVISRMLDEYQKQTSSLDWQGAREKIQSDYGLAFSDYDFLKMASLIQKEATKPEDKALVSSVFYNRLKARMALQSDATMAYSLGHEPSADDLKRADDYNSYLNQDLPLTPICSPSKDFIEAAFSPAQTKYLFFLIIDKPTYTTHTFSETYEEHLRAIQEAQSALGQ